MTTKENNNISDIMDAYRNYAYSVRAIETIITRQSDMELYRKRVRIEGKKLDTHLDILTPIWHETKSSPDMREIFEDIGQTGEMDVEDSCCVFINSTDPKADNVRLQGYNPNMHIYEMSFEYPTSVSSVAFLYKYDAKLKDMSFLVDGKYFLSYNGELKEEKFSEAVKSSYLFYQQLETAISAIIKKISLDGQKIPYRNSDIWFESYASTYIKDLEVSVLENQGKFVEYARQFFCQKLQTSPKGAFAEAEKQGLISSAERFNEYKDIRNLLNHPSDYNGQSDLAVKKGKNNEDALARMQATYSKYYTKPLRERISTELEILYDFQTLLEEINPNFIVRKKGETSNKFIQRLKKKITTTPAKELHVDINCPLYDSTYKKIKKNINKLFPDVILETECPECYSDLNEMCEMSFRKMAVSVSWGELSRIINYYFMSHGIKVEQSKTLKTLQEMRVLSPQQMISLYQIRQFRNDICHNIFTPEVINKLKAKSDNAIDKITEIGSEMIKKIPVGTIKNDVIEFKHEDGKVVKVNKDTREIISVHQPKANKTLFFKNWRNFCK